MLDKNKALVVVNDDGHVLGYEPGVPDAPGWKLAVSRQTRGETPVVVYKAVGPAMVILTFEDDFDAPALDPTKWHAGYRLPGAKATPPRPAGPPRVAPGVTPKARL